MGAGAQQREWSLPQHVVRLDKPAISLVLAEPRIEQGEDTPAKIGQRYPPALLLNEAPLGHNENPALITGGKQLMVGNELANPGVFHAEQLGHIWQRQGLIGHGLSLRDLVDPQGADTNIGVFALVA